MMCSKIGGPHTHILYSQCLDTLEKKAFEVDKKPIVARRLKRAPSILSKLHRENGMKLDRMEDIAGCRIVVSTLSHVRETRNIITGGRTRNILRRERDYIKTPKESGYRGIHLIYRYNGAKREYSSHSVELQIRSKVQHSWATAVEVVGTFTGQSLKASQGHEAWLNFFKLASKAFEDIEHGKLKENKRTKERKELIKYIERMDVVPKLRAFAVSTRHLGNGGDKNSAYFLLLLEVDESNIKIFSYLESEINAATDKYAELEKKHKENSQKDVVLVSAESLKSLRKAYPNYFADTTDFTKNIEKILKEESLEQ